MEQRQRQRRRWAGGMSLALSAAMGVSGFAGMMSLAFADSGDGTATVRVVRAVDASGRWEQGLEPGMAGVTVTLTDAAGRSVTGVTMTDGTVKLSPGTALSGGKYRIEVQNPKPGVLFPGFATSRTDLSDPTVLSSNVEFVDLSAGKNAEVTTSLWSPEDYCQKNATLVTACQDPAIVTGGGGAPPIPPAQDTKHTLTSFPFNQRGGAAPRAYPFTPDPGLVTDLATNADTGALWGVSYDRATKQIFSGAFAVRGSKYGPGGPGAVYMTDPATKQTHLFTTVPNAGTTRHDFAVNDDEAFGPVVGKEALGGVKVTPDGKDLYVVNLGDGKMYRYDATQTTAAAPKASYPIPDPGCAAPDDWHPFGLGIQDGKVYAGGVCSAQSTGNKADMKAVVFKFDPRAGQFTGTIMDQPLNFPRGAALHTPGSATRSCQGEGWFPWTNNYPKTQDGKSCLISAQPLEPTVYVANPEPLLSDIHFETNGDLVLGFADRFVNRYGYMLTPTADAPKVYSINGGDINRACPGADGMFVMDGNGGCVNNASPTTAHINQRPDAKEFYPGDYSQFGNHLEASHGGIALDKVEGTIPFTALDPTDIESGHGVRWISRTDGTRLPYTSPPSDGLFLMNDFGKSQGIGELEVLCDQAPLQIGNRVWYNTHGDGIQNPDEKPVTGATVNLYNDQGAKIGTTVTNARGEYYFDSTVSKNVSPQDLVYGHTYTVKMDNPNDYAPGGPLHGWVPTLPDQGSDNQINSKGDGTPFPAAQVTPNGAGQNDHDADFGFKNPSVTPPVTPIPLIDPAIGGTVAAILGLGGTLHLRRRNTTRRTMQELSIPRNRAWSWSLIGSSK